MAKLYDAMFDHYRRFDNHVDDDIQFYLSFTRNPLDHYLEVGCGTGRILLPLLKAGYQMTGVDTSQGMLDVCIAKTNEYVQTKQLQLTNHNFSEKPLPQPHNGVFVTGFALNYVPEQLQLQFLRNIGASLTESAQIVLDLFVPLSLSKPKVQNKWIEKGEFDVEGKRISLRDKRWMLSPDVERRIQEFRHADGTVVSITTDRIYIPPQKAKEMLESAGFHDVSRYNGFAGQPTKDFSETLDKSNFVIVATKAPRP